MCSDEDTDVDDPRLQTTFDDLAVDEERRPIARVVGHERGYLGVGTLCDGDT